MMVPVALSLPSVPQTTLDNLAMLQQARATQGQELPQLGQITAELAKRRKQLGGE